VSPWIEGGRDRTRGRVRHAPIFRCELKRPSTGFSTGTSFLGGMVAADASRRGPRRCTKDSTKAEFLCPTQAAGSANDHTPVSERLHCISTTASRAIVCARVLRDLLPAHASRVSSSPDRWAFNGPSSSLPLLTFGRGCSTPRLVQMAAPQAHLQCPRAASPAPTCLETTQPGLERRRLHRRLQSRPTSTVSAGGRRMP
jgi:hypothetical protein